VGVRSLLAACVVAMTVSCGDDGPGVAGPTDRPVDAGPPCSPLPAVQVGVVRQGCDTYPEPVQGTLCDDDFEGFARPFLDKYCLRCHLSSLATAAARNAAPPDANWDDDSVVRDNLDLIRTFVGNGVMPPSAPFPTCEERFRMVLWLDSGAP